MIQINSIRDTIRRAPAEGGAWTGDLAHPLWEYHAHTLWEEDSTPPPMPKSFVLLGDFNLEAKDPEYDHLVGPKDGDLGRLSSSEEFIDTWVAAGHDEGEGVTFPTTLFPNPSSSDTPGMRLDYAFVDQFMESHVLGAWIDETAQGSDHQPYWIELDYAPLDQARHDQYFDIFKIGIGPSSCHAMTPMKAARAFLVDLNAKGLW